MPSPPITLTLWGDWSPAIGMNAAPLDDPAALYGGLYPVLQRADLNILNLEGVFIPPGSRPIVKDGRPLSLPEAALPSLRPFGMVCLANNHLMDYGEAGLRRTLEVLNATGIAWTGITPPEGTPPPQNPLPAWLHLINAAEGEEARAAPERPGARPLDIPALCAETREQTAAGRTVVAVLHTGREHWCIPAPYVRDACRALAEAGAALVVGHHPHVPQGMETWNGTPIFYSLGNFVLRPLSGWRWHPLGYGVEARFSRPGAPPQVSIHPYEITPAGLHALERKAFTEGALASLSAPLKDEEKLNVLWDAYVDDFLQRGKGMETLLRALGSLGGTRWGTASLWRGASASIRGSHLKGSLLRRLLLGAAALLGEDAPSLALTPEKARQAAILRNRFDTPAHREVWLRALSRMMDGSFGDSPPWAVEALKVWRLP
ncbi:MAG TPA: hypothetical protein ENJ02_04105 [Chloroflexi bacterium]|nr:hypothetical protein [Chloroflexota bacterium]